jgi:dihydroorotate dehydrogenase
MYGLLRRILFLFDPEKVHYLAMAGLKLACGWKPTRRMLEKRFKPVGDHRKMIFGLEFPNPIGLAAGFDKNALYLTELEALGFGFIEIGTVTPEPQNGNPRPRLFRLPKDKALINRMGFNNDGAKEVAKRLKAWKEINGDRPGRVLIGGNIGKNKVTPNEDARKDYLICFQELFQYVDYFVINVSSPNTPGLRALQSIDALSQIIAPLQRANLLQPNPKPVLLKIAPDLPMAEIKEIADLCVDLRLDGIVATNTTISREGLATSANVVEKIGNGGLSGKPVQATSTDIVKELRKHVGNKLVIIGSGGVFTTEDAREKINAGADLVQVWTGFIYEGPRIVNKILSTI